jgi:branched-chain amino acid transport system substrate-binding protein
VAGDITFGPGGEWTEARVLEVQFQNIQGNGIEQFKDPKTEVVLYPPSLKNGDIIYPYSDARR